METFGVTVDCSADEIDELAEFWAAALGYKQLVPGYLVDIQGVRPRLVFQVVPEPKTTKNRWHLDLYVERLEDLQSKVDSLVRLGATELLHVDDVAYGHTNIFTATVDPRGNEFCVCAPHVRVGDISAG